MSINRTFLDRYYKKAAWPGKPNGNASRIYTITEIVRETEKAFLVAVLGREIWIPKSQAVIFNNNQLYLQVWIAESKGLPV